MFKKILIVFFIWLLSLTTVGTAYAIPAISGYFSDSEVSQGNNFSASSLYFNLSDTSNNPISSPLFDIAGMQPSDSQTKQVRVTKGGLEDFKYNITFSKNSGDDILCSALQIEAKLEGVTLYSGSLTSISLLPVPTISSSYDDLEFKITLPDGSSALKNKTCSFNLVFEGWQTNSDGAWGFSDTHSLTNNISSGTWTFSNAVVINEIMWMGSTLSSDDEWIELRNTTADPIDLTGWKIDRAGSGSDPITLSGTIPANGFFLVSNYQTNESSIKNSISSDQVSLIMSLDNGGEQLVLKNASGVIIDQTPAGSWARGEDGADKKSMERNDVPAEGSDFASWHTCEDANCHSTLYWDNDGHDFGTPKGANLSSNDPTAAAVTTETVVADESAQLESVSTPASLETPVDFNTAGITPTPTPVSESTTPEATPTPTPSVDQPQENPESNSSDQSAPPDNSSPAAQTDEALPPETNL